MSSPELVRSTLEEEDVIARVPLRDDDALFVSPTRTVQYRGQSLLSDESGEEFPHTAERVSVSSGRRKATIELDYGLDGTRELAVPTDRAESALHPILAGVLSAAGVTESGETVRETFRFSELTLVVTDRRLIKHVGRAVWDEEYEEFPFDSVSGFVVEDGQVASQFVLTVAERVQRLKIPNERTRAVRERLESVLLEYHEIETLSALPDPDETSDGRTAPEDGDSTPFEPASVETSPASGSATPAPEPDADGGEPPAARIDALSRALDDQEDLLAAQRRELDRLREDLTRAR
ncbi:MAG: hypothetical protein QXG03_03465 [Halalkalicoccus sp.]